MLNERLLEGDTDTQAAEEVDNLQELTPQPFKLDNGHTHDSLHCVRVRGVASHC